MEERVRTPLLLLFPHSSYYYYSLLLLLKYILSKTLFVSILFY
jgi:hypothetical protein